MSAISAEGLVKHYGHVHAVDGLDLKVAERSVTGLIGPNGAGKTTTIKMILGILRPNKGSVTVFGENPWDNTRIRRRIGVIHERSNFPPSQKVLSYLERVARIYGVPEKQAMEGLARVGLLEATDRQIKALSAGMLQKFALAHAIMHEPEMIIADEPTSNLDPIARTEVLNLFTSLAKEGKTFLISSHILPELSRICDSAAIVNKGKIWAAGRLAELYNKFGANSLRITTDSPDLLLLKLRELPYVIAADTDGQGLNVRVNEGTESRIYQDASQIASQVSAKIFGIESRSASLEELFKQAYESS